MAKKLAAAVAKKQISPTEVDEGLGSSEQKPKLTDKQRLFIEFYMGKARWNATEAARLAGYAEPNTQGPRLLVNVGIKEQISKRIAAVAMGADEVLLRLAEHARGSFKPFLSEGSEGELWPDLTTDEAQANIHLLKKIKPKKRVGGPPEDRWVETEIELELYDSQAALVHMGRHHKLFTDKTEVTGENGTPVFQLILNEAGAAPETNDGFPKQGD